MQGIVFANYQIVEQCIARTSTKTGFTVVVRLNLKQYPKGTKISEGDIDKNRISYHPEIPDLNYRIYP